MAKTWMAMGAATLVLGGLAACSRGPTPEQLALMAQKDSLVQEMAEQTRMVSDISAELAKVQVAGKALAIKVSSESPRTAQRDTVFARINAIKTHLSAAEKQLAQSRRRIRGLTHVSDSLKAMFDSTISNYESVIASQKTTMQQLTDQIQQLTTENTDLKVANTALTDTVGTLKTENSTVYYIVGTKDELKKRGIIQEVGGSHFLLIFGKRGTTLVPSRDLQPSDFTAIDKNTVTDIPLPTDGNYRLASRQDVEGLASPPDKDGRVRGPVLKIAEPQKFWAGSKYLIIVQS
jgi:regulator of replication initiation timing